MILFLGVITSYEDYKFGKIRNKWVISALLYSIVLNSFFLATGNIGWADIGQIAINSLTVLVIAFAIWQLNLWSAGDAKLFFSFSMLVPLEAYKVNDFGFFSSGSILLNTLVFAFMVFLISSLRGFRLINTKNELKKISLENIVRMFLVIFSLSWMLKTAFLLFNLELPKLFFLLIPLSLLLYNKISDKKLITGLVILSILRLAFDKEILSLSFWYKMSYAFLVIFTINLVSASFLLNTFLKNVRIKDLKQGMIPAELIYKRGKTFRKIKINVLSGANKRKGWQTLFYYKPEGLSNSDLSSIRRFKYPFKSILIQKTVSFAIFIFAGVLLTIVFQGNMVLTLINFLKTFF